MQFLNPVVLIGLVAAVAPLAIHLLHRGQSSPVPFSNLRFLRRVHHSRMRRVRLRQWLVLLLRTLIILLIVLAFARPAYRTGMGWWAGKSSPVNAVILLDRSLSTTQLVSGGTAFSALKARTMELAALFSERDRLLILPFDEAPGTPLTNALEPRELQDRIAALQPGQRAKKLQPALQAATGHLEQVAPPDRELFILTDMAPHGWPEPGTGPVVPDARIHVVPPPAGSRRNAYVESVDIASWMPAAGHPVDIHATVVNAADHDLKDVKLDLYLDGERVRHASVDLARDERRQVRMTVTPRQAGTLTGVVELEDDDLTADNRHYFVLDFPHRLAVLLVGDTSAQTYYLRRALGAAALTDPVLTVESVMLQELDTRDLSSFDVVVLCNVRRLDRSTTNHIHDFVGAGGGLVLVPAPTADLTYYNRALLPGLLPATLRDIVRAGESGFQRLDANRPHHPLFTDLLHDQDHEEVRFSRSFHIIPGEGLEILVYFADGRPALVAGRRERGRVFLWAAPLELDWSDIPLRGMFVPMWHRIVRELALPDNRHDRYLVGQPVLRSLTGVPVASEVQAVTPSGQRLLLEPELRGRHHYWRVPPTTEAGIWSLRLQGREVDRFAVNVDIRESRLGPVDTARMAYLLGADNLHVMTWEQDARDAVLGQRYGHELWRELLVLALVLLMVEQWIARAPQSGQEHAAAAPQQAGTR